MPSEGLLQAMHVKRLGYYPNVDHDREVAKH